MSTGWILISKAVAGIDSFTERLGRLLSWFNLLLVGSVFTVVILRYWFNSGSIALQEAGMYFHALIFLGASSYCLKNGGHVRVDVLYNRMNAKQQALVNSLGTLLLLMPVCLFIGLMSWDYVAQSWRIQEVSQEAGGLSFVYLLKSLILFFVGTMVLQGLAELLRSVMILMGKEAVSHG
ncbi:C4-dicarboxylate ABC transporter permease [Endozoicomonas sp. OPT23]|uniref:TRAP transporter small permease subunit n=1 Tax=Endozoicomonas sp. OPT23 TaxID=2072845 RepID=UPI00129ACE11|nr:TRAP transporter small permease subunit [Endozoicomonas sp. OPT23]MRI31515.1 C4-dicarboxylate ABC transporter permease [Endozoicomonas sp. OPT23]